MVFGIGLMLYGLFALYPEMLLKIFLPGEEKVVAVTLEFIDWFKPVSYTHLDVYKRQP